MIYQGQFKVTSKFGVRVLNGEWDDHMGIDIVGITDKLIRAVVAGVVVSSTMLDRAKDTTDTWQWGNYVCVLGDDGKRYYYCHMSERRVVVGQRVEVGGVLGVEGYTGYCVPAGPRGSHCHFEVRDTSGVSVNPAPFLGIPNAAGTYGQEMEEDMAEKQDERRTNSEPQEWAAEAVEWAVENGIIYGDGDGNLMLRETCTREQVLVFVYRMFRLIQGG